MAEAGEAAPPPGSIRVMVAYSPQPRQVHEWALRLPAGATVMQAIEASGLPGMLPGTDLRAAVTGIWGRKARADQPLRDHDRVEVYRPLKVDPKIARRERFRKQGARAAGLFARKGRDAGTGG